MDRRQLLLLDQFVGDVVDGNNEVLGGFRRVEHRRGMQAVVAVVRTAEHRGAGLPGREGRMERTKIGPQNFRGPKYLIEVFADYGVLFRPLP
jgi:hypothetical protein